MSDILQKFNLESTMHEIAKFHFVLAEGRKGNHLLFDAETIRGAFSRDPEDLKLLLETRLEEVNDALNETFTRTSFEEKRDFISGLSREVRHAMIFGYFQLLDGLETEETQKIVH